MATIALAERVACYFNASSKLLVEVDFYQA